MEKSEKRTFSHFIQMLKGKNGNEALAEKIENRLKKFFFLYYRQTVKKHKSKRRKYFKNYFDKKWFQDELLKLVNRFGLDSFGLYYFDGSDLIAELVIYISDKCEECQDTAEDIDYEIEDSEYQYLKAMLLIILLHYLGSLDVDKEIYNEARARIIEYILEEIETEE